MLDLSVVKKITCLLERELQVDFLVVKMIDDESPDFMIIEKSNEPIVFSLVEGTKDGHIIVSLLEDFNDTKKFFHCYNNCDVIRTINDWFHEEKLA